MATYKVVWEIEVEADSFEEAAQEAFACQATDTTAVCFEITDDSGFTQIVDLLRPQ